MWRGSICPFENIGLVGWFKLQNFIYNSNKKYIYCLIKVKQYNLNKQNQSYQRRLSITHGVNTFQLLPSLQPSPEWLFQGQHRPFWTHSPSPQAFRQQVTQLTQNHIVNINVIPQNMRNYPTQK